MDHLKVNTLMTSSATDSSVQSPSPPGSETFPSPRKQPASPPTVPGDHPSTFCLYECTYFGQLLSVESYDMWPFVTGSFHLTMSSRFIHVIAWVSSSFYFMDEYYPTVWMDHILCIHSSMVWAVSPFGCCA